MINGLKWFTSGAVGADLAIAMVITEPEGNPYARASMILVPSDAPGYKVERPLSVMGHSKGPGHCEVSYTDCRVPKENLLGERGAGFLIAQDRLGPGRIHHCMRAIGTAERALEMMCVYAAERQAFGGPLADKQFVQDFIAKSRMEIDQARLLTLHAAWKMDTVGKRAARQEISMIKVVAANMVMDVLDRAIQVHGSLGMTDDTPLAMMWRLQPDAAAGRRSRRGPQDGDRPKGSRTPAQEAGATAASPRLPSFGPGSTLSSSTRSFFCVSDFLPFVSFFGGVAHGAAVHPSGAVRVLPSPSPDGGSGRSMSQASDADFIASGSGRSDESGRLGLLARGRLLRHADAFVLQALDLVVGQLTERASTHWRRARRAHRLRRGVTCGARGSCRAGRRAGRTADSGDRTE